MSTSYPSPPPTAAIGVSGTALPFALTKIVCSPIFALCSVLYLPEIKDRHKLG